MGNYCLYTDEEKHSIKKFFDKTHKMSDSDLFRVNNNLSDDVLPSEMKDLVAWEIRIRELETTKRMNIDLDKEMNYKNANKDVHYHASDIDPKTGISMSKEATLERNMLQGMTKELLDNTIRIIENNPIVIDLNEPGARKKFHSIDGGGINIMTKKVLVKCENGDEFIFNNQGIQEHFRKEYVKRMSEECGFDFTKYDLGRNSELFNLNDGIPDTTDIEIMDNPVPNAFGSDDDFEDD